MIARAFATAALSSILTLQALAPAPAFAQNQPRAVPNTLAPSTFADLAERLLPAVVSIQVTTTQTAAATPGPRAPQGQAPQQRRPEIPQFPPGSPFEEFFKDFFDRQGRNPDQQPQRKGQSLGSGFVIDATGYIVTNNHVIDGGDEIRVVFHDNATLPAKLVGKDQRTDLALLKVESKTPLAHVTFGDSDKARVGDWVVAIGNPLGLGGSVTQGIISARNRDINAGPYDDFIQTDASINRGNSGGPLFNLAGDVVGVNTAIYSQTGGSIGIGFSIPSAIVKNVVAQLRKDGRVRRGWLGVNIQTVSDEIAESVGLDKARGAMVAKVPDDGPAAKADIRAGDVIVKFDGKDVTDMRRLPRLVAETPVDKTVKVEVWRNRKSVTLNVKLGELEEEQAASAATTAPGSKPGQPQGQAEVLGMTLAPITPDMRQRFQLSEKQKGVVVTDVVDGSVAQERGIRPGDVIVEVAQSEITQPQQVQDKVKEQRTAGRKSVLIMVERAGEQRFVGLPVEPRG
ncbi:MAG: Do family serine endopeptidase [Alphaproteobacteria bacterium]|nr:Do family serine endopeptidase [Alphaproteobacteria bacterium]